MVNMDYHQNQIVVSIVINLKIASRKEIINVIVIIVITKVVISANGNESITVIIILTTIIIVIIVINMTIASGNETITELAAGSCLSALWAPHTHICHCHHHHRRNHHHRQHYHHHHHHHGSCENWNSCVLSVCFVFYNMLVYCHGCHPNAVGDGEGTMNMLKLWPKAAVWGPAPQVPVITFMGAPVEKYKRLIEVQISM